MKMVCIRKHARMSLLLVVIASLSEGCATSRLIKSAKNPMPVSDRVEKIECAFVAPRDRLLVCLTGALPQPGGVQKFTLSIPLNLILAKTGSVVDVASAHVVLPRSVIREGWPSEADRKHQRLQPIGVYPYEGNYTDCDCSGLQVPVDAQQVVYAFTPDCKSSRFVYVRRKSLVGDKHYLTFSLSPPAPGPTWHIWMLTPFAVVLDLATFPISAPLCLADSLSEQMK